MDKEGLTKRYLVFIIGLYFLALGIVMIVRSSMGTTPISSINYVCSINTPLSLGTWTFITNLIMIALQLLLIRGGYGNKKDVIEILLQIPLSFVFSAFIDLNMWITNRISPFNYGMSVVFLLIGCIIQSVGVVLEIKPKVAMMSAEGLVKYLSRRVNKEFGKMKVYVDLTLVSLAILASLAFSGKIEGVREGSVIAALITGYIVSFLNHKIMTRKMIHRLIPVFYRQY